MKIRSVGTLVGLAISFAPPSFGQQKDTPELQIAQQRADRHERNYPTSLLDREHRGHCCQRGGRTHAIRAGAGRAAQVRAREGCYLARAALEALRAGR